MNLKKLSLAALSLTLTVGLLSGCSNGAAGSTGGAQSPEGAPAVKTGLSVVTTVSGSKSATAEADGKAASDIVLVAVTVGDDGVIDACAIDTVQAKIGFNAKGELTDDPATLFPGKNELGADYGMKKASGIGKEWNEQAAAFADYVVGKTLDEVKGIAVDENGKATGADLTASVTVGIEGFVGGVEAAIANAAHLGAQKGDKLALTSVTNMAKSKNATAEAEGQAQAYATLAAVTTNGDKITGCTLDAVQATVKFNAAGAISTDLTLPVRTKNELGADYGMKKASGIGKEWNEQAAAFAAYVTGKTLDEVKGIAVDDHGSATTADLTASVTIGIGEFQELLEKAAK